MAELLRVNNLKTQFKTDVGLVKAVDDVSFYLNEMETVGFVGESGCGKSVSQLSVMQLISSPGKIVDGEVIFGESDLLKYAAGSSEMRAIRGSKISMIFQEPMTSLNPVLTINKQLSESLIFHMGMDKKAARARSIELLAMVGIPSPEDRIDAYPHQFSGGMRQRVMIAMGLSCNPKILIADEPTTALDVTTQAQLLELMMDMVSRFNTSLVIITHNLGIVARYAQRLYIMYAGRIVESGTTEDIFGNPRHPYTIGLLNCIPRLDEEEGHKLDSIKGLPPNLINLPPTCAFLPRCKFYTNECLKRECPPLESVNGSHQVRCYVKPEEIKRES